jgi:hypothetical protein
MNHPYPGREINTKEMRQINEVLKAAGHREYPGDLTLSGRIGRGYVRNLLDYVTERSNSSRDDVLSIVSSVLG